MQESIEEMVIRYQSVVTQRDEAACTDLYNAIRVHCVPITQRIAASFKASGLFTEDHADAKLQDCLAQFTTEGGGRFEAMYRMALSNKIKDEWRRKRAVSMESDDAAIVADVVAKEEFDQPEFRDAMELYRLRKRSLINQLTFQPISLLVTLLLDQRHRMTTLHDTFRNFDVTTEARTPRSWIEHVEIWEQQDELRPFVENAASLADIWARYAERIESDADRTQTDMIDAIRQSGIDMSSSNWRKRVSRYLKDVREQVDELEWRLFHT